MHNNDEMMNWVKKHGIETNSCYTNRLHIIYILDIFWNDVAHSDFE